MASDVFSRAAYLERIRRAEDEYRGLAHRDFLRVPDCFKQLDPARQVTAVITDATVDDYGASFAPAGCDPERYLALSRAVFFGHNTDAGAVAWCVTLDVSADAVIAVAQFPPAGAHEVSDFVWDRIRSGEARGASIGSAGAPDTSALLARSERYSAWELREWSICAGQHGANPAARVIEIGGRPLNAGAPGNRIFAYAALPGRNRRCYLRRFSSLRARSRSRRQATGFLAWRNASLGGDSDAAPMIRPTLRTADLSIAKLPAKVAEPFYSTPAHRAWRTAVIARANGACEWPGCGRREPRMFADHIVERKDKGDQLRAGAMFVRQAPFFFENCEGSG